MTHGSLEDYYVITFNMMHHHKYSLRDIENMYPFEFSIYVNMFLEAVRKKT